MTLAKSLMSRIVAVTRTVPDLAAAARFYGEALDFRPAGAVRTETASEKALLGLEDRALSLLPITLGSQRIVLLQVSPPGAPYPDDSGSTDLWFQHCAIVVDDIEAAWRRVTKAGALPISRGGPQHLPANTGGVTAFKFRDPFGHPLELLQFPPGVGDPVWHTEGPVLFRGIDHTALAVSTARPDFYTDVLGLSVADQSHNRGPAQARLDAVPEDDVDVVALSPAESPPHLELLAYRTGPRRRIGTPAPGDAVVQHTVVTADLPTITQRLAAYRPGGTALRHGTWDGRAAIAFADPDGHAWICQAETGQPSRR